MIPDDGKLPSDATFYTRDQKSSDVPDNKGPGNKGILNSNRQTGTEDNRLGPSRLMRTAGHG